MTDVAQIAAQLVSAAHAERRGDREVPWPCCRVDESDPGWLHPARELSAVAGALIEAGYPIALEYERLPDETGTVFTIKLPPGWSPEPEQEEAA